MSVMDRQSPSAIGAKVIAAPRRARRLRVHEEVAAYLLEDIRQGVYPEGALLPSERQLMDAFAVGRPAIRETLAKLGRIGVIELKPGVRPRVCKPHVAPLLHEMKDAVALMLTDPTGQHHMQQIRTLVECGVARHAAGRMSAEALAHLHDLLQTEEAALGDAEVFAELDSAFHRSIAEVWDNPVLNLLHKSLASWLQAVRLSSLSNPGQSAIAHAAHGRIYAALAACDGLAAMAAMEEHLQQVLVTYPPQLEETDR